jgi:pimeloyl-ACP methyl ester carboxylesterase
MLNGKLLKYSKGGLVSFLHGSHPNVCILIGGLTDGPLSLPYTNKLAEKLDQLNFSLALPVLRSSYAGYGISSLSEDSEDLCNLISTLQLKEEGKVILLGHSTGCQSAVTFMRLADAESKRRVSGVILQAPVSDREFICTQPIPRLDELTQLAESARPDELMPRDADPCGLGNPITAYRFLSLTGKEGDDDLFSSDLSDEQLKQRLGHVSVPCLVIFSLDDEYVPLSVNRHALQERLAAAMPRGSFVGLKGVHNLKGLEDELTSSVATFIDKELHL